MYNKNIRKSEILSLKSLDRLMGVEMVRSEQRVMFLCQGLGAMGVYVCKNC